MVLDISKARADPRHTTGKYAAEEHRDLHRPCQAVLYDHIVDCNQRHIKSHIRNIHGDIRIHIYRTLYYIGLSSFTLYEINQ